jgi:multidrug efflux pump subunit AcrA (membrane-fusion protein)
MTANVDIQAERREDVLVLPNEAVQFGRGGYYVELKHQDKPDTTTRERVKIGITDGLYTEIVEGLTEGQEVALPASVQSRWVQGMAGGPGGRQGGAGFDRGMRMATFRLSGAGGGRR